MFVQIVVHSFKFYQQQLDMLVGHYIKLKPFHNLIIFVKIFIPPFKFYLSCSHSQLVVFYEYVDVLNVEIRKNFLLPFSIAGNLWFHYLDSILSLFIFSTIWYWIDLKGSKHVAPVVWESFRM